MPIDPKTLYEEWSNTLAPGDDPASPPSTGSQCATYGYCQGNGTSLQEKLDLYNTIQDNGTGRPITVTKRSRSGPGKVVEPIFAQAMQENIDWGEYLENFEDPITTEEGVQQRWFELVFLSANPDTQWALTDELQVKLNTLFDQQKWPDTRAALFAAFDRPGSRSEEQWGVQATQDDATAAEQYAADNGLPSLKE